ncbi:MAG TPA: Ku protein [Polyangia bacterium]|jgi:DNA end-binding protein Ku
MLRPLWTGSVSFGLVNIPIRLFSATESHRIAFHELEKGTGQRIRHKRVAAGTGHDVPWEKIEKGYEVGKNRYVVLSDEELEAAEPVRTHTVDIEEFIPLGEIDPVSFDQSYYAAPDGEAAAKAYALLREAMLDSERVAIGRLVLRTKEYIVCVRPYQGVLAVHTLFFPDEVRSPKSLGISPPRKALAAPEKTLARQLISTLEGPWSPDQFHDTFRQRVEALVKKKQKGQIIEPVAETPAKSDQIVDLMSALKATLSTRRTAPTTRHAARKKTTRRKSPLHARGRS